MINFDSIIEKGMIKDIVDYQEDLDSEARAYKSVMKNSEGLTFRQLGERIFKIIYPGAFPDALTKKAYFDEFMKTFNDNLISHLNNK